MNAVEQEQLKRLKEDSQAFSDSYSKRVVERLIKAMEAKGMSQADVLKECAKNQYYISQSTLSKVLQGSVTLSLVNAVQLCKALHVNLAGTLSLEEDVIFDNPAITNDTPHRLIYRPSTENSVFRAYLGEYHCYFFSTISSEEKILHGKLTFEKSPSGDSCVARMCLKTGKTDRKGEAIEKKYVGHLVISTSMNTAYCTLTSKDIGEICYFIFHYNQINYEDLVCKLALAITASAGSNRLPTAHRMLISREDVGDVLDKYLSGHLKLNGVEILIDPQNLDNLNNDPELPSFFKDNLERYFLKPDCQYLRVQELSIRASMASADDKMKCISLLRKYSSAPKYTKIGSKADEYVHQIIKSYLEDASRSVPTETGAPEEGQYE